MYSGRQPWVRFRRRAAMWLLAAWAVFTVSPVLAACCTPSGHPVHASAAEASPQHHGATQDDCCDAETLEQPCPMVLGPAPSAAATTTDYMVRNQNSQPIAPPIQVFPLVPIAFLAERPARIPIPAAPPDPILLRLQRFLI
jgi:hypothetical protein